MEAVMLVEQIGPQGHPIQQHRFAGAGAECRIGRDLACDIVVDDEHAAPQHTLLTLLDDGRVRVQDLGTRNGTRVDWIRVPADAGTVIEQGEIIVGRTRLRVRTRHTPIGQERVFRRDFIRRHRTLLASAGVAACLTFAGFQQWLDAPTSLLRSVTTAALAVLGALAIWTGVWALINKLNKGVWVVRVHLAIASMGAAFAALGYWVAGLVAYAAQSTLLAKAGGVLAAVAALVALYLHLREATRYGRRVSLSLAAAATLVIGVVPWIVAIGIESGDVNEVDLGPDVRLGAHRFVPNRDIADYLAEVDKLQLAAGRERQKSLLVAPLAGAGD
ncbi:MAG: FHA domain-containing protein [Steroidobacteraceae bacterium]